MEKILVTLRDVATQAGVTVPQVKYWVKLLDIEPVIRGRAAYLEESGSIAVETMARLVASGTSPREAANIVRPAREETVTPIVESSGSEESPLVPIGPDPAIATRLAGMERVIMALVEEVKASRVENMALRLDVAGLREQVAKEAATTRLFLTPPDRARQVIPWKPSPAPEPLQGQPWYVKAWVRLVDPARLRRCSS